GLDAADAMVDRIAGHSPRQLPAMPDLRQRTPAPGTPPRTQPLGLPPCTSRPAPPRAPPPPAPPMGLQDPPRRGGRSRHDCVAPLKWPERDEHGYALASPLA